MPQRLYGVWVLLVLLVCGAAQGDWPTFRHDNARTGICGETLPVTALSVQWAVQVDEESVDSSPAVVGERVVVGAASGKVCAVAVADGRLLWEANVGGAVMSSPAVGEGKVFVGSADRCLYAFDLATGKQLWRVRTRGAVVASPLYEAGRVYFGSMDGGFRCVSATEGAVVWRVKEEGEISASAACAGGVLFYGDEAGNVIARTLDGKQLWSAKTPGGIVAGPMVTGEKLIVPVMSPTALSPPTIPCLVVYNRGTGEVLWSLRRSSSVVHTPVADAEYVYFATVSGYLSDTELIACHLTDGKVAWRKRMPGVVDSSPALAGEALLLGVHDGALHVLRVLDGQELQAVALGPKVFSSPALSGGRVFIGSQGGKLTCLK